MAIINNPNQNIKPFASNALVGEISDFGSNLNTGSMTITPEYLDGLKSLGVNAQGNLILNEASFNGLLRLITQQIAYLYQNGIPEYRPKQEYANGALIKEYDPVQGKWRLWWCVKEQTEADNNPPHLDDGTNWQEHI